MSEQPAIVCENVFDAETESEVIRCETVEPSAIEAGAEPFPWGFLIVAGIIGFLLGRSK